MKTRYRTEEEIKKKKKRKRHQKTGKTPNGAPSCSKSTTSKEGEKKKGNENSEIKQRELRR